MDILDDILSSSPSTWRKVANSNYDDGYYSEQLSTDSAEYRLVAQEFTSSSTVRYIKRVQNPFQLALFKISREKAKAEDRHLYEMQGYHVICEADLDTALKYTVDYRRYEHSRDLLYEQHDYTNKQPKFYRTMIDAVSVLRVKITGPNKLVLICDVLSEQSHTISTRTQADYHVNYVVCIE